MSFSAIGLFGGLALTGAGIAGVAGWSAWLAVAGLTLLGLVGMKEAILWRWRREQERAKLRAIAEAVAGERDETRRAIAGERDARRAIADECERAERALKGALAQERSDRSLVDVHLADRGLPLRRILLLFTIHRSGSTWLFDMLRTHPAIRVEPTSRAWTELDIDGLRYPGAFHHAQGASMPLEVAPGRGAAIPVFPRADVPGTTDVREADRWALEKAHPQFVGFEASRLAARVRNLRENGLEIEIVYGVRCPLDAMWSMVEYKNRNPQWYKVLPLGEVPRFFARSLEVLAEVRALFGGSVIEYETLPNSAALNRLGRRLDSAWNEAAARAWLAHAASVTERSRRTQRPNAGFLGERNRSRDQAGPDGAWRDAVDAVTAARDAHRRLTCAP